MTLPNVNSPAEQPGSGDSWADPLMQRELERIRASNVLGDGRLRDLFEYLVKRSASGETPKEMEIAIDVFGKTVDFDVTQDALVRVYVHKLRRILETYQRQHANDLPLTLRIPRGTYRLVIDVPTTVPADAVRPETPEGMAPAEPPRHRLAPRWWMGVLCLVVGFLGGAAYFRPLTSEVDLVRRSPAWQELIRHDRPMLIVVSDYYMFGDLDPDSKVVRLIRDPSVNSKGDLDLFRSTHPSTADRFKDVGSRYLPTSIAAALRNVVPVLTDESQEVSLSGRPVALSLASELTPDTIKYADVIYVGELSGLGSLASVVFSGSRYTLGPSFDELVDSKTANRYVSQTESQTSKIRGSGDDPSYHDYGYFAEFRAPGGNIVVIIAGTRDEGVRQTAELFTNAKQLDAIRRRWHLRGPFEALVDVTAVNGVNFTGKILYAGPR